MTRRSASGISPAFFLAAMAVLTAAMSCVAGADGEAAKAPPPAAKPLQAGEWAEYLVAYPADALESLLRSQATGEAGAAFIPDPGVSSGMPIPTPETVWTTVPLRLEFRRGTERGFIARMTHPGGMAEVEIPLQSVPLASPDAAGPAPADDMDSERFDGLSSDDGAAAPDENDGGSQSSPEGRITAREVIRLDDRDIDVDVETVSEPIGTYVRWTNPDLPFGLARLATPNVDMILTGWGLGTPPPFPLDAARINPPPGKLIPRDY